MFESRYFLYRDRISIHYQTAGQGPVALIFLHGFASAHSTWHDMAGLFPSDRYSLYLIDLKGFGLSDKPRDGAYTIKDQAEVIATIIREQTLRSVILVGHSMGGAVALRVALQALNGNEPFVIEKLVLIDCAAYPQRLPKFFRRLKSPLLGPLLLRLMPLRMLVRGTLDKVFFDPAAVTPERFERYRGYLRGKGIPYVLRATVKGIDTAGYARIGESYRTLAVSSLIIWGEEDRVIRVKNAHCLHGDLRGSRLKVLMNCGHNPQEEQPRETFAHITAFLAR
jgi:pimeloyl-ACP methyl ester carboxylesterase